MWCDCEWAREDGNVFSNHHKQDTDMRIYFSSIYVWLYLHKHIQNIENGQWEEEEESRVVCLFDALLVPSLSLRYRPDNSLKFPTPCSLISGTVSPEQHHHYPWLFLGREQYNKHWSSVDLLYSSGCTKWDWGLHIIWIAIQTNRPQRLQSWSEGGGGGGGLVRSWFWGGRDGWGATLKVH